ncbi:MAG: hypothetical protein ACE5JL_00425 [Dehalococcoidia bacterium]
MFLLLALLIMGPLLRPGYLLTLDSPLALNWDLEAYFWGISDGPESVFAATYNSAPIAFVLKLVGSVLTDPVTQKLWLILLFWLSSIGAYRLPFLEGKARYYAGVFYAVNPYTYTRFVAGQWGLLGAYALTPFAVTSFIRMLEHPRPREAAKTVFFLTLIGFLQVHGLLLALLVLAVLYIGRLVIVRGSFRHSLPMVSLGAGLFVGLNLFWILRYAIAGGGALDNMRPGELGYFAASPPLDVLSLRGFWLQKAFTDISDLVPVWWLLFFPLFFLATYGAFRLFEVPNKRWLAAGLVLLGVISVVLAAGPGVSVTEPAFGAVWDGIPWYRAFRDSHKFVAPLALTYTYLGAFGLQRLFDNLPRLRPRTATIAGVLVFIIPMIYALPIFGSWGQLQPTEFPEDWLEARSMLDDDPDDYNVLVLPWHMYMDFAWLPNHWKRLANPAPNFLSQPTISGDNIEIAVNFSDSSNPVSRYVESLLGQRDSVQDFGKLIAPLNAKYVVLFKDGDYESYDFLLQQDDLKLIFEGETVTVFLNLSPTARGYAANDIVVVDSLDDYFNTASGQDFGERLYLLGSPMPASVPISPTATVPTNPPRISRSTPISYRVQQHDDRYLVFTLPQHRTRDGWEYRGNSGTLNLNMMPAFRGSVGGGVVSFSRFYYLILPTYVLAAASAATAALIYWRTR